ncbi:2OG-Fe(II) oxygenase [Solihabitans fulvus]|uniref:2OG-Fe(II) oxygenase n=1 Tax=Solihabitans fulvus TaxID=1892852 RepID=UPI001CB76095|nr:2OG-Fe(II) oxygenase [Solihabitans fulvus]
MQQFAFRREDLFQRADSLRAQYLAAEPFPHVVIDDFLPAEVLEPILEEFPEPQGGHWQQFDSAREVKLALADTELMGPATRQLLAEFNGQVFVDFVERLTGIDGLIPDPHFDGGGLHQTRAGGYLKMHADFNKTKRLNLDRRLNGILYLNKDWQDSWGGQLELWDREMTHCVRRVAPVFNRFLLFCTTDDANHGLPDPLACPPERARRSMALYYYTNGRPDQEATDDHTTLFRQRPGEQWRGSLRQSLKRWVPPAVADLAARRRKR